MAPFRVRLTLLALLAAPGGAAAQLRRRAVDPSAVDPASAPASSSSSAARQLDAPADEPPLDLPGQSESLIAMQFTDDPYADRNPLDMLKEGLLGLSGVRYMPYSFSASRGYGERYGEVLGEFCVFDATLNKEDPAKYPTAHALMGRSEHCGEHRYTISMEEALAAIDAPVKEMAELPVTGMVFHEGHAGAGLISNALATFDAALVVAEHPALRDALSACDVNRNRYKQTDCSEESQQALVKDVARFLSRTSTNSGMDKLYLKLSSESTAYLSTLRSLFPDAKWAFVYRQPHHALAKATAGRRKGACIKNRRNPSSALVAKSHDLHVDLEGLGHHEVCALHLSTLLDAAAAEHEASGTGMLVSYDNVLLGSPDEIVRTILPYLGLQKEIDADPAGVAERVSTVLATKAHADKVRPSDAAWRGEEVEVSAEVAGASEAYLTGSMDALAR
ncbi:hypothetical protein ACHAXT_003190 [Thalassiosira profunda]